VELESCWIVLEGTPFLYATMEEFESYKRSIGCAETANVEPIPDKALEEGFWQATEYEV
jgi:hypothetical protein